MKSKDTTKFVSKEQAEKERKWYKFDAKGKILGRFAQEVAKVLRGKHKTNFTPNNDTGDGVIIVNAKDIRVTGAKEVRKEYIKYTGHIGGLRKTPYRVMKEKKPEYILEHAIKGMLPKTRLGEKQFKKLHVFKEDHTMTAQKPIEVNI